MKTYDQMTALFESADTYFREQDKALFWSQVSERTLCGALMLHLHDIISMDNTFAGYHVDVEYNRNKGNIKTIQKEISDNQREIIPINCDLIVHSRGECIQQDNLIAIEMKKSHRTRKEKDNDRARLVALTKDSFDDVWAFDGVNPPEHVCGYILGVYYEIDYRRNLILIEYYHRGTLVRRYSQRIFSNGSLKNMPVCESIF